MGMGIYACSANCVNMDFIREICPNELDEFLVTLDRFDISFDNFCSATQYDDDIATLDDLEQDLVDAIYDLLVLEFNKKTDLELGVIYHSSEDRGDELDGGSFTVDGVFQYTPAGEKYKDKIEEKVWTVWG